MPHTNNLTDFSATPDRMISVLLAVVYFRPPCKLPVDPNPSQKWELSSAQGEYSFYQEHLTFFSAAHIPYPVLSSVDPQP
jgi:hypothetical protein